MGAEVRLFRDRDPLLIPPHILKNHFRLILRNILENILRRIWPSFLTAFFYHTVSSLIKNHALDEYSLRLDRRKRDFSQHRITAVLGKVSDYVAQSHSNDQSNGTEMMNVGVITEESLTLTLAGNNLWSSCELEQRNKTNLK